MTADPITSTSSATGTAAQNTSPDTARGSGTASAQATATHAAFCLPSIASPETQEPARLIVGPPLPEFLARGLVIIQGLEAGLHCVRIDLADPTHRVIDSQTVRLEISPRAAAR